MSDSKVVAACQAQVHSFWAKQYAFLKNPGEPAIAPERSLAVCWDPKVAISAMQCSVGDAGKPVLTMDCGKYKSEQSITKDTNCDLYDPNSYSNIFDAEATASYHQIFGTLTTDHTILIVQLAAVNPSPKALQDSTTMCQTVTLLPEAEKQSGSSFFDPQGKPVLDNAFQLCVDNPNNPALNYITAKAKFGAK